MKKKLLLLIVAGTVASAAALFYPAATAHAQEKQNLPPSQMRMDSEDDSVAATGNKPQEKNQVPVKPSPNIAPVAPSLQAQPSVIPAADTAVALPCASASQNNEEKVFREMDRLNLEIARVQMEMKLASLQIQKLQLEVQKTKLQEELAQHHPEQGGSNLYAAAAVIAPAPSETPEILSIMSYAGQKSALLKIDGHTQEIQEGEKVDALGAITRIEPENDFVVVSKGGVEHRLYVLGSEKNNG